MNDQAMRFRVGVFVLASLILLAVLITLFGGFPALFKAQNPYTVIFSDAPGVGPGTPVRRSGVRIGEVQHVELDDATGEVRVRIAVDRRYTIRDNDQPTLMHGLLGGDTTIDFVPRPVDEPPAPNPPVEPGAVLHAGKQAEFKELIPALQSSLQKFDHLTPQLEIAVREYRDLARATRDVLPELRRTNDEFLVATRSWNRLGERLDLFVQTNQDKLAKTLDNLNDTFVRISNVFNEENQRNLNATLKNVRAGSDNLESITKNTDEFLKDSRKTIQRVNDSVRQADEVFANLQRATKPMAERSDSVMRNLDDSTMKLNRLLDDSRELLKLFKSDGSFHAFLTDPTLYNNLTDVSCMLTRVLPRVDRAMRDLELFADKIARHPEALGLGGVVTPGSGLKK